MPICWRRCRRSADRRAGITVRSARETDIRQTLHPLLRAVFADQNLPVPYPQATLDRIWERYCHDPSARLTVACYEERPAAFSITIGDGTRAYNWLAVGTRALRQFNPLTLLYWEDIRWAASQGYREFDLVGTPNPGIADYKRQFGAEERRYLVATRENSRLARWARAAHGRLTESLGVARRESEKGQRDED
jgi:Acetyltransferase (GNAT) domain